MYESIFKFVINKSIKLPAKLILFILIVLGLFIVDNIIGYTYYRNIEKKTAQFEKISELKEKRSLSYKTLKTLEELELDLNSRVNILDKFTDLIKSILKNDNIDGSEKSKDPSPRNNTLLFFLSNWIILITLFPSLIGMIDKGNWEEGVTEKKVVRDILSLIIIIFILSIITYYLIGLIPMIGNNWIINYIIAALIQPVIFGSILFFSGASIEKGKIN